MSHGVSILSSGGVRVCPFFFFCVCALKVMLHKKATRASRICFGTNFWAPSAASSMHHCYISTELAALYNFSDTEDFFWKKRKMNHHYSDHYFHFTFRCIRSNMFCFTINQFSSNNVFLFLL